MESTPRKHLVQIISVSTRVMTIDFIRSQMLISLSRSPLLRHSHLNKLLTRFFVDLVNDALAEKTYDANCAGMGYGFGHSFESLHLSVSGYNQKLLKLLKVSLYCWYRNPAHRNLSFKLSGRVTKDQAFQGRCKALCRLEGDCKWASAGVCAV